MTIFKTVVITACTYFYFIKGFSQHTITQNLEVVATEVDIQKTTDDLFLNKGIWGVHYLKNYANLTQFLVNNKVADNSNEVYEIERQPSVSGLVKGNINLFRHLLAGDQTLDVTDYNTIEFNIINNQPLEIILMPEDLTDWQNRLRYTIPANNSDTFYSISFNDFVNASGITEPLTNIKTIVFSVIGDYTTYKLYSMEINSLALKNTSSLEVQDAKVAERKALKNYPNPFKDKTTIKLPIAASHVNIKVYDMLGRIVHVQNIQATNYKIAYEAPNLAKGIYKYTLKDNHENVYVGTFFIE